jgi:hypothetical protein
MFVGKNERTGLIVQGSGSKSYGAGLMEVTIMNDELQIMALPGLLYTKLTHLGHLE